MSAAAAAEQTVPVIEPVPADCVLCGAPVLGIVLTRGVVFVERVEARELPVRGVAVATAGPSVRYRQGDDITPWSAIHCLHACIETSG